MRRICALFECQVEFSVIYWTIVCSSCDRNFLMMCGGNFKTKFEFSYNFYLICCRPNLSKSQFRPLTSMKVIKISFNNFFPSNQRTQRQQKFYCFIAVQLKRSQLPTVFRPLTICHLQISTLFFALFVSEKVENNEVNKY